MHIADLTVSDLGHKSSILTFGNAKALADDMVILGFICRILRLDLAIENDDICQIQHSQLPQGLLFLADLVDHRQAFRPHHEHVHPGDNVGADLRQIILELVVRQVLRNEQGD